MKGETLERLLSDIEARRAVVLVTDIETGQQRLLYPGDGDTDEERTAVEQALRSDRCVSFLDEGSSRSVYQPHNPPLRLIIVGAVHIAQVLSSMASMMGYEVTIVDPRESFAASERFEQIRLERRWPDEALRDLSLDARCAVVTLTHDPKLDDPALQVALRSDAFFIGSLGSRKTHASRLGRLSRAGFNESELARIHGPVGLPIGARSPAEIAVSVIAQITEALHRP